MSEDGDLRQIEYAPEELEVELPGIDTPVGSEQRLKLHVLRPDTLVTLGAIGNNDAAGHKAGPAGFALRTVEHFSAEVHKNTIIDTDLNTIIHTKLDWTGVAGEKINLSTNGDYQLGTKGGLAISAASGAGFTDPAFTVDPQMDVPAPPAIDTAGPRSGTEAIKAAWEAIWKIWDAHEGPAQLLKWKETRKAWDGFKKKSWGGKASAVYGDYKAGKKIYDAAAAVYSAGVAAADHFWPDENPSGDGKPKITLYADDGVTIMTPASVDVFATKGGINLESPKGVGIKGGVSASMEAGNSATVFSFISTKVESKGTVAISGKMASMVAKENAEMKGGKAVMISAGEKLGIDSEGTIRMSAVKHVEVSANEVVVGSDSFIRVACDDVIELHASNQNNLWGDKKVYITSDENIEVKVKDTLIEMDDQGVLVVHGDNGLVATSDQAVVGTNKAQGIFEASGSFEIKGKSASKIKAPNISIG